MISAAEAVKITEESLEKSKKVQLEYIEWAIVSAATSGEFFTPTALHVYPEHVSVLLQSGYGLTGNVESDNAMLFISWEKNKNE